MRERLCASGPVAWSGKKNLLQTPSWMRPSALQYKKSLREGPTVLLSPIYICICEIGVVGSRWVRCLSRPWIPSTKDTHCRGDFTHLNEVSDILCNWSRRGHASSGHSLSAGIPKVCWLFKTLLMHWSANLATIDSVGNKLNPPYILFQPGR